jgi:hypothetical protein
MIFLYSAFLACSEHLNPSQMLHRVQFKCCPLKVKYLSHQSMLYIITADLNVLNIQCHVIIFCTMIHFDEISTVQFEFHIKKKGLH